MCIGNRCGEIKDFYAGGFSKLRARDAVESCN